MAAAAPRARLATLLPSYQPQFTSLVDQFTRWLGERGVTQEQINAAVSQFDLNSLVGVLQRVVTGATGVVSDLAFILALLFFLILDSSSFPRRVRADRRAGRRRRALLAGRPAAVAVGLLSFITTTSPTSGSCSA